jgi:aminocarboxymuconate-semialdehyde decarboxylase
MVKAFFYVTILHDRAVFDYLAAKVGRDRLVVGSDYAFTIEQDQPAEFAEKELAVPREIFESNARRWLGLGS